MMLLVIEAPRVSAEGVSRKSTLPLLEQTHEARSILLVNPRCTDP